MSESISLPLWAFIALVVFAAWAALDRLIRPTARWVLRRRVNAIIEELSSKLQVEISSFKLMRRSVLIDRLVHDERVQVTAEQVARDSGEPVKQVTTRIDRYAREIVPSFNAYIYFRIGYWLAKIIAKSLYRVRLGYSDEAGLSAIDKKSTLVFVINHRSNFDYVLVAFLAAERAALSYAVGEWARVWPLQALVRSMGAYFVRRNSGNPLYRAVLQRYVQMATEAGVTQAIFPEGGLTIDGNLRTPKLGLIDYMMRTFNPHGARDLVFIPVAINYDRVLEDRTLIRRQDPAARSKPLSTVLAVSGGFVLKNLWLMLTRQWHRFGYACVNFGSPVSMRAYLHERNIDFRQMPDESRHEALEELGGVLMDRIRAVIPVLPVSLVATVLLDHPGQALSTLELKAQAQRKMDELQARGAHIYVPRNDMEYAIDVGLRMLLLRRIAIEENGLIRPAAEEQTVLRYYANAIAHFWPNGSANASAVSVENTGSESEALLRHPSAVNG